MAKLDFSAINKSSAKSFHDQRNLIKNLGRGKTVLCPTCQQPLKLVVPGKKHHDKTNDKTNGVRCDKGCTDIELEFAP
ncbi:MAG: hypothetical protein ACI8WB_004440 [Phenylobacterium sp.]|jgi:hypothetical protein